MSSIQYPKMRGIYYNSKYRLCSIWESGKMCYDALSKSTLYTLDYSEEASSQIDDKYDFMVINYHHCTNNWMQPHIIENFNKPNLCIVTEIGLIHNLIPLTPDYFDKYIILDPSIQDSPTMFGFGRPLEEFPLSNHVVNPQIPHIGSFGIGTPGKAWHKIIECVNNEFDNAVVNLNIIKGDYVPEYVYCCVLNELLDEINKMNLKPGVTFNVTNDVLSKSEVVDFCRKNTINCFFYNRNTENIGYVGAGLAAATDQAITSERPMIVSSDPTFRHVHKYLDCYPNISIKEAIEKNQAGVLQMKRDWSSANFLKKFENILFA